MLCQFCVTFCATEKQVKNQNNQYISRKTWLSLTCSAFFEFVLAYLSYLEDMKNKDTIYWGIPWRVWRYQRGNHNPLTEEEQTTQWSKEKGQLRVITKLSNSEQSYKGKVKSIQTDKISQQPENNKQRSIEHTHKTKDRVTRTPLKTGEIVLSTISPMSILYLQPA